MPGIEKTLDICMWCLLLLHLHHHYNHRTKKEAKKQTVFEIFKEGQHRAVLES